MLRQKKCDANMHVITSDHLCVHTTHDRRLDPDRLVDLIGRFIPFIIFPEISM
jgi:hypothetical protein